MSGAIPLLSPYASFYPNSVLLFLSNLLISDNTSVITLYKKKHILCYWNIPITTEVEDILVMRRDVTGGETRLEGGDLMLGCIAKT